jgi:hypothetical protein
VHYTLRILEGFRFLFFFPVLSYPLRSLAPANSLRGFLLFFAFSFCL